MNNTSTRGRKYGEQRDELALSHNNRELFPSSPPNLVMTMRKFLAAASSGSGAIRRFADRSGQA
jgi:hypothetical protein